MEPRKAAPRRLRITPAPLPATVRLRGGNSVVIRRVAAADSRALQQFFRDLSPASRYRRFLRVMRELPEDMLTRLTQPDATGEAVLVASLPHSPTRIIGIAQYAGIHDVEGSEIAVVVGDSWQRRGLGYHLLDTLMTVAVESGIERLHADVLADNHAMRELAHKLGFEIAANPAAPFLVRATKTVVLPLEGPMQALRDTGGGLDLKFPLPLGGEGQGEGERRVSSA
jgi:acetyltransferase